MGRIVVVIVIVVVVIVVVIVVEVVVVGVDVVVVVVVVAKTWKKCPIIYCQEGKADFGRCEIGVDSFTASMIFEPDDHMVCLMTR